ncbi:uncharacterized protein V1516DRAFT_681672 [Lipomyces oligophaga]|uniref:uncharacterized protein n=1 Tax=Lipomyces oligophaga TaxID=45792 RepID=UPI0034CEF1CA
MTRSTRSTKREGTPPPDASVDHDSHIIASSTRVLRSHSKSVLNTDDFTQLSPIKRTTSSSTSRRTSRSRKSESPIKAESKITKTDDPANFEISPKVVRATPLFRVTRSNSGQLQDFPVIPSSILESSEENHSSSTRKQKRASASPRKRKSSRTHENVAVVEEQQMTEDAQTNSIQESTILPEVKLPAQKNEDFQPHLRDSSNDVSINISTSSESFAENTDHDMLVSDNVTSEELSLPETSSLSSSSEEVFVSTSSEMGLHTESHQISLGPHLDPNDSLAIISPSKVEDPLLVAPHQTDFQNSPISTNTESNETSTLEQSICYTEQLFSPGTNMALDQSLFTSPVISQATLNDPNFSEILRPSRRSMNDAKVKLEQYERVQRLFNVAHIPKRPSSLAYSRAAYADSSSEMTASDIALSDYSCSPVPAIAADQSATAIESDSETDQFMDTVEFLETPDFSEIEAEITLDDKAASNPTSRVIKGNAPGTNLDIEGNSSSALQEDHEDHSDESMHSAQGDASVDSLEELTQSDGLSSCADADISETLPENIAHWERQMRRSEPEHWTASAMATPASTPLSRCGSPSLPSITSQLFLLSNRGLSPSPRRNPSPKKSPVRQLFTASGSPKKASELSATVASIIPNISKEPELHGQVKTEEVEVTDYETTMKVISEDNEADNNLTVEIGASASISFPRKSTEQEASPNTSENQNVAQQSACRPSTPERDDSLLSTDKSGLNISVFKEPTTPSRFSPMKLLNIFRRSPTKQITLENLEVPESELDESEFVEEEREISLSPSISLKSGTKIDDLTESREIKESTSDSKLVKQELTSMFSHASNPEEEAEEENSEDNSKQKISMVQLGDISQNLAEVTSICEESESEPRIESESEAAKDQITENSNEAITLEDVSDRTDENIDYASMLTSDISLDKWAEMNTRVKQSSINQLKTSSTKIVESGSPSTPLSSKRSSTATVQGRQPRKPQPATPARTSTRSWKRKAELASSSSIPVPARGNDTPRSTRSLRSRSGNDRAVAPAMDSSSYNRTGPLSAITAQNSRLNNGYENNIIPQYEYMNGERPTSPPPERKRRRMYESPLARSRTVTFVDRSDENSVPARGRKRRTEIDAKIREVHETPSRSIIKVSF